MSGHPSQYFMTPPRRAYIAPRASSSGEMGDRILDALRGCHLSGNELRHALHCSHEDLYSELVRLEARGRLKVLCDRSSSARVWSQA